MAWPIAIKTDSPSPRPCPASALLIGASPMNEKERKKMPALKVGHKTQHFM